MTDLTVRLVLTADGRPLRTEIVGATRQVEQFTQKLEQEGVRVQRVGEQAERAVGRMGRMWVDTSAPVLRSADQAGQAVQRIGGSTAAAGQQIATAMADAAQLATTPHRTLLRWIVELNMTGAPVPFIRWDFTDARASAKRAAVDATLAGIGYRPTAARIRDRYGEGFQDVGPGATP
jgi:hypothetical protein